MSITYNSKRCLLLAGGGFRFVSHLGFYHALCQRGWQADLLLTTCGGMMAAQLIRCLPDAASQQAFLRSAQCWQWFSDLTSTDAGRFQRLLPQLLRRKLAIGTVTLAELDQQALVKRPSPIALPVEQAQAPAVVTIASQLTPSPQGLKLQQLLLSTAEYMPWLSSQLHTFQAPLSRYLGSAVVPQVGILPAQNLQQMSDIAVSDPYYFAPYRYPDIADNSATALQSRLLLGGVIDLQPIELALQLSRSVIAQRKDRFDSLASQPALRRVFGVDMNEHLAQLEHTYATHPRLSWANAADIRQQLPDALVGKKLDWQSAQLRFTTCPTLALWQAQIDRHWHYGTTQGLTCPLPVL